MGTFAVKTMLLFFLAGFAIFFGMEAANRGIAKVYGPMDLSVSHQESWQENALMAPDGREADVSSASSNKDERTSRMAEEDKIRTIQEREGLAEKTGRFLQSAALGIIRIVASLFDRVL